jgi:hypothetical protein
MFWCFSPFFVHGGIAVYPWMRKLLRVRKKDINTLQKALDTPYIIAKRDGFAEENAGYVMS